MPATSKRIAHVELGERLYVGGQMYEVVKVPAKDPIGNIVLWLAIGKEQTICFTMHMNPMLIMEVFHPLM